jgi:hypothetical protein
MSDSRGDRKLRRSQTLAPFGVGAIFDVLGESLVAEDTTRWYGRPEVIDAGRIARLFGVDELRTAPPAPENGGLAKGPGLPFFRFPQWMFCPRCRRMERWSYPREKPGARPTCGSCAHRAQLVPMRFVMICGNGHLDDVDWGRWAHSASRDAAQQRCQRHELFFRVDSRAGGGLESLIVQCATCKSGRNLRGIASPETPRRLGLRCRGRQPWQSAAQGETCDANPVIVQRGASNVHFPVVASAIDIPPGSDFENYGAMTIAIRNDLNFKALEANPSHPLREGLIDILVAKFAVDRDEVEQLLTTLRSDERSPVNAEDSFEGVLRDEWDAFTNRRAKRPDPNDRFVAEHRDPDDRSRPGARSISADLIAKDLAHLVLAPRLREIRALRGFYRYDMLRLTAPDIGAGLNWLPAVEVYGEGVFFALREERLVAWEARPEVAARCAVLHKRLQSSIWSRFLPPVSPRFVMLHTLAHLLMRQLTYESGYSSASLRERLYIGDGSSIRPMAGALIYTGAGDSEGTLGGLVRNGEPDWFIPTILAALRSASWCSLDPVCRESAGQGPDSLSLAACHACSLVSETSCDHANSLLDRQLVIDPNIGYFARVMAVDTAQLVERIT